MANSRQLWWMEENDLNSWNVESVQQATEELEQK